MDESQSSLLSSLPPFLSRTYEMINDLSTDAIVSWSQSDESFVVRDPMEFAIELLPRFFKHNNFSSFVRQLNTYGFRKIDPEQWEFANENFVRGKPHLLRNIHRRKPVHSHSQKNTLKRGLSSSSLIVSENKAYEDKISMLKNDKQHLLSELEQHKDEERAFKLQMQKLKDRFMQIEEKHRLMLFNLSLVPQKPNKVPGLALPGKKRRLVQIDFFCEETDEQQHSHVGNSELSSIRELYERLDSSLTFWDETIHDISQACVSCGSDLDVGETTSCVEEDCPDFSSLRLNTDANPEIHMLDMNLEPPGSNLAAPEKLISKVKTVVPTKAAGVNDVFWEQFLTENPGGENQAVGMEGCSGRKNHMNGHM